MKVGALYDPGENELRIRLQGVTEGESRQTLLQLSRILRLMASPELRAMGEAIRATVEEATGATGQNENSPAGCRPREAGPVGRADGLRPPRKGRRPLRIVIADSDPAMRRFYQNAYRRRGHQVLGMARNCEQAVKLCHALHPDLLLIGVGMADTGAGSVADHCPRGRRPSEAAGAARGSTTRDGAVEVATEGGKG
jgi:CheY-like chemotaxis protein